jgi:hypothetical protein
METGRVATTRRAIFAALAIAAAAVCAAVPSTSAVEAAGPGYTALTSPARLVDSRGDGITIDGQYVRFGARPAGSVLEVQVTGRAGVPAGATTAIFNVTAVDARADGFLTVFPCGDRPNASNVNYVAGQVVPNAVIARLTNGGTICIFSYQTTDLVVDVSGYFASTDSLQPIATPARLMDTRSDGSTIDGQYARIGARPAGSVVELVVAGRAGIPTGATSVVLNVTAVDARANGFLTAFPCGSRPNASNVNYVAGQVVPNAVIAKLTNAGTICIFSYETTDIVVDVSGYFASTDSFQSIATPSRLMDTRVDGFTIDGQYARTGLRPGGGTVQLQVDGRAGIPPDASSVVLNVTAADTAAPGFVTVYPVGQGRPTASNLNYVPGQNVPNLVVARVGAGGAVCLFTYGATHLVVDVAGYFTGPAPGPGSASCPPDPPPPQPPVVPVVVRAGTYVVGSTIPPGRYIARNARNGCYWERLRGFGGTLGEIIANDFQSFSGPVIVDLLSSDLGFTFDADCGTFQTYQPSGPAVGFMGGGSYVVGSDIAPGTYVAQAQDGCYWERRRDFTGNSSAIIANDFLSGPQTAIVTIAPTDVGFHTDADCGTWLIT